MPLIGTAGHVDHGKSTLVQALTGRDPDRWAEEKRRGLTIDLGFAWADLGHGVVVSFVDVPGHERYLKNMLAGVESVEIALLVVAANEGWKPQTEEHLAVLDLLEVRNGVVALTKTDIVDRDLAELEALEAEDKLVGTSLEGSAVIPVSALTGQGLEALRAELARLASRAPTETGRPRLWIDRVFSVSGAGTVATGSLLGGKISVGDEVELYPGGRARVRTIQSHEEDVTTGEPGRRTALGIAAIDTGAIGRGTMIGYPGEWNFSDRFSASVRLARYIDELPDRGAYQIHIGTLAQNVTIEAREADRVILRLTEPVPVAMGDRFIIRDSGRRVVAAGGRVLDPHPGRRKTALAESRELSAEATAGEKATQLLRLRGSATVVDLERDSGGGRPSSGIEIAGTVITDTQMDEFQQIAVHLVEEEHSTKPLNPGLPLATLSTRLKVPAEIVEAVVKRTESLELRGPDVALVSHNPTLSPQLEQEWAAARSRLHLGLAVPTTNELGLGVETIHLLLRNRDLVRISEDLVFLPGQIDEIVNAVAELNPPFSVGDFKEKLGLSRKYAMPLLEWLDNNNYTVRRGDQRVFGGRLPRNDQ
jgi:selenocysteine-specific elongation factor